MEGYIPPRNPESAGAVEQSGTPKKRGDIIENIRRYIQMQGLDKKEMWCSREFLNFYYAEKLKMAKLLMPVLQEFQKKLSVQKENADNLRECDNHVAGAAIKKIRGEERKLNNVFKAVKDLPVKERNERLIRNLKLEELFEGVHPHLCRIQNLVVAVLSESDYDTVHEQDGSGASFSDEKIPIIMVRADIEMVKTNVRNIYNELLDPMARNLVSKSGIIVNGTNIERAMEDLAREIPFEAWYAAHVLVLPGENDELRMKVSVDESELDDCGDFDEKKSDVKKTIMHEFHHSVCRFLPVGNMELPDEGFTKEEALNKWIACFADECVVYSWEGRIADPEYYAGLYDSGYVFETEEERIFVKEGFMDAAKLLTEINRRINRSKRGKLLSTLFSLEKASHWKGLHEHLIKGGLRGLGYYRGELGDLAPNEDEELY